MSSHDEDIGYLKAQVIGLKEYLEEHVKWEEKKHTDIKNSLDDMRKSVDALRSIINDARTTSRVIRWVVVLVVGILSWKFGDVQQLWHKGP